MTFRNGLKYNDYLKMFRQASFLLYSFAVVAFSVLIAKFTLENITNISKDGFFSARSVHSVLLIGSVFRCLLNLVFYYEFYQNGRSDHINIRNFYVVWSLLLVSFGSYDLVSIDEVKSVSPEAVYGIKLILAALLNAALDFGLTKYVEPMKTHRH